VSARHTRENPTQFADSIIATYREKRGAADVVADDWATQLRERSLEDFQRQGLPHARLEAWRHTNLRSLAQLTPKKPSVAQSAQITQFVSASAGASIDAYRVVVVNGQIDVSQSLLDALPEGVLVTSLEDALLSHRDRVEGHLGRLADGSTLSLAAANTALFDGGVYLRIAAGVVLDKPFHILNVCAGVGESDLLQPRLFVDAGSDSEFHLIEEHTTSGSVITNSVTECRADEGAAIRHLRIVQGPSESQHLATVAAEIAARANYEAFSLVLGGGLVRSDIRLRLIGSDSHAGLDGVVIARGTQHVDHHTYIEHGCPNTTSRERFRHVLADRARGVFMGRVDVVQDAQKTDAEQNNHTLLLSDDAVMNTMPQLRIYADDVRCTHGATLGQLDETALFYMRSRGIGADEARALLMIAFVNELLASTAVNAVAAWAREQLSDLLPDGAAEASL
jgi:Fe-S cluster assembly protein SufD